MALQGSTHWDGLGHMQVDDALYNGFVSEQTEEFRRTVMDQLRREAGKVDKDGRFELIEGYRKRLGAAELQLVYRRERFGVRHG